MNKRSAIPASDLALPTAVILQRRDLSQPAICIVASKMEQDDEDGNPGVEPPRNADIIDTFGTLSVSDHGVSRFFGPTGGSEVSVSCFYALLRIY